MNNSGSKSGLIFLFLVWGKQGPRSRVLAEKLGIDIQFIFTSLPRGKYTVPFRYPVLAVRTIILLFRRKPNVIFVQNPPFLAVLTVYLFYLVTNAKFIIDSHSDAMLPHGWTAPPIWLKRLTSRKAVVTIVTNLHFQKMIESFGGKALVIRDIPTEFKMAGEYPLNGKFNVVFINTFDLDEPTKEVIKAAENLSGIEIYITGKIPKHTDIEDKIPDNVHFTDFLEDSKYYSLLNSAHAIMCLTTRNHTMQRGACEALSLAKPIITSDWPILQEYFNKGSVFVDNTPEGIRRGLFEMQNHYEIYKADIKELQLDQQKEWQEKVKRLINLIEG